jgi:membrane protein YqaA with SNARE-associated domain
MPDWFSAAFADLPLLGLLAYSFLAATLLPGGSEIALAAYVAGLPDKAGTALIVATIGNTLGGFTSWLCGRFLPPSEKLKASSAGRWMHRFGAPVLLLSWVPLIGDLLCLAAGWLRINPWHCVLAMAAGKGARYWLVIEGVRLSLS